MMQDVMDSLYFAAWLLLLCSLIFVVILNLYLIKRNGFYVNVNCWFCNSWTKVLYSNRNSFECPTCQQYNGFDKDGGYNRVIKAQHSPNTTDDNKTIKKTEPYTNGLCNYCNNNQQLKVFQLANFTPINDNNYDLEVEHFQKQLEKSYKLCMKCENVVKTSINKANAWVFGKNLQNLCRGLSFKDQRKSSEGITRDIKLYCCKLIRYTLIVFTILIICQILNIKIDYPTTNIKKISPRLFESYKIILRDTFGAWSSVEKYLEKKLNISSYMPVNIKITASKLVPITFMGFLLGFILLICDKKSVWWKINDLLGWTLLILSSTLSLDSGHFVYINILQESSDTVSLHLMETYNTFENWKGKGENPKPCKRKLSKRSFYLNPESEWSTAEITESQLEEPLKVCLLKNGGLIKYSSRQTKEGKISLTNTCAFDSLIQGLATSFCDSKFLAGMDQDELNNIYCLAKQLSIRNCLTQAYTKRAGILSSCFQKTSLLNLIQSVDCQTTIYNMVKILNLNSYQEIGECNCGNVYNSQHSTIICSETLSQRGIEFLQSAIDDADISVTKCNKCEEPIHTRRIYENIVFIEVNTLTEGSMKELPSPLVLGVIPKTLNLMPDRFYHLRSCIAYEGAALESSIGHFWAVCRRNNNHWEVYNDMQEKVTKITEKSSMNAYLLIYTL